MRPSWQGSRAEQREWVRQHYGQAALDLFVRGGTMALVEFEKAERDRIGDDEGRAY